jgi:hypothetical protein
MLVLLLFHMLYEHIVLLSKQAKVLGDTIDTSKMHLRL